MSEGKVRNLLWRTTVALLSVTPLVTYAQAFSAEHSDREVSASRCIGFALYVQGDNERDKAVREQVDRFVHDRRGIRLRVYDVDQNGRHRAYLEKICKYSTLR